MKWDMVRVKRWIRFFKNHLKEKARGLDFSMVKVTDLHFSKKNKSSYYGYCMTDEEVVKEILGKIHIDRSKANFMDIGCGKGMCLKVAEEMGFAKVSGLELDHSIAEIGRRNMNKLKLKAEIIEDNAIEFSNYKDYDVFYFYNPFGRSIFQKVIEKIVQSIEEKPREVFVAYLLPMQHDLWEAAGFKKIDEGHDNIRDLDYHIYKR
ncbi:MAG: methyltransferase [Firmicutes bacterium]|nr:methyltransferase [Bacillota bacterium]